MDSGDNSRDHSNERRHFSSNVHSLSGIAGGGQMTMGVDDAAMIREHGFEKRHFEQADEDDENADSNQDSSEKNSKEPSKVYFSNEAPDHGQMAAGLTSGIGQMTADHGTMTHEHALEKKHFEQAHDDVIKTSIEKSDTNQDSSEKNPNDAPKGHFISGTFDGVLMAAGGDYGAINREHGFQRKHFEQADDYDEKTLVENVYSYKNFSEKKPNSAEKVHSLSGIAGGGQMTGGVDDGPMVREHGFEKRHYEQADDYDQAN